MDHIPILRRQSGGGAVYHDLGNLNYTIITPKKNYNKEQNLKMIIEVLKHISVNAFISPKGDILVHEKDQDYKISGSAFREIKDKVLHHGTLLINSHTNQLYNYLHHNIDDSLITKGVHSRRTQVINLSNISPVINIEKLIQTFLNRYTQHITYLPENLMHPLIIEELQKIRTWDWLFGKTLPFQQNISLKNNILIKINIEHGKITKFDTNKTGFDSIKQWIHTHQPTYCITTFTKVSNIFSATENKLCDDLRTIIPNIKNIMHKKTYLNYQNNLK